MAVARHRTGLISADEFYTASQVPEKSVELVEGEVVRMTPAGWRHGEVAANIAALFRAFRMNNPDCLYCGENNGFLIERNPDTV